MPRLVLGHSQPFKASGRLISQTALLGLLQSHWHAKIIELMTGIGASLLALLTLTLLQKGVQRSA